MRVLLLNPPHPAVASRCHEGHMTPLGLLAVGGPLIDAGRLRRRLSELSRGEVLARHREIDVVVRGEGEATGLALIDALAAGRSLANVPDGPTLAEVWGAPPPAEQEALATQRRASPLPVGAR